MHASLLAELYNIIIIIYNYKIIIGYRICYQIS